MTAPSTQPLLTRPLRAPPPSQAAPAAGRRPRFVEPWYLACALHGAAVSGLAPILLPLLASRAGGRAWAGYIMAALNLGGLSSPLWGHLTERYRLHRWLLAGGLAVMTLGFAGLAGAPGGPLALLLALGAGAGSAAASTVAALLVVAHHPRPEWDERIGWLQTSYGVGQVAGLAAAGALSRLGPRAGLLLGGGVTAAAALIALRTARAPGRALHALTLAQPPARAEPGPGGPPRACRTRGLAALRRLRLLGRSRFGLFAVGILCAFSGSSALYALYPVLMRDTFAVSPALAAGGFAVATGLGLGLYARAGRLAARCGAVRVLRLGAGLRAAGVVAILVAAAVHPRGGGLAALASFGVVVLAYSPVSVAGTTLAAALAPGPRGAGLGVFNAVIAVACVVGGVAGGWVAARLGYVALLALAAAALTAALVVFLALPTARRDAAV
ncbi:MAG TPA: MFS transporter [Polyangia bacterium]